MKDVAAGKDSDYYIEREDGRIEKHSIKEYNQTLLDWSEPERLGIQHATGTVLDVGCGAGRVSLYLQNQGLRVVGIDIAKGAVEACKIRGLREAYVMSANELEFPEGMFDAIVLYGNNFGILGEEQDIISMFQKMQKITKPDAVIIAGSTDVELTDDPSHLAYQKMNLERERPKGFVRLRVKYKDLVGEWTMLRLASPEEMKGIAERAGWKISRVYQHGARYVAILTKR